MGKVVVVGSIGGDVVATTETHPRPGETVVGSTVGFFPGGKGANQAAGAARAGAATEMIGRIGADAAGMEQRRFLGSFGVDCGGIVTDPTLPTQTAIIVLDASGENTIVVVAGASGVVTSEDATQMALTAGDVVVCQFEIPQPAVAAAFGHARDSGATTVLNLAPAATPLPGLLALVDVLVVNETEAGFLLGRSLAPDAAVDEVVAAAREIRAADRQTVIVTLGARGAVAITRDEVVVSEWHVVNVVDTTGAGDCFVGYLAHGLATGVPMRGAMETANHAASLCVQRMGAGTSMPAAHEVEQAVVASASTQ